MKEKKGDTIAVKEIVILAISIVVVILLSSLAWRLFSSDSTDTQAEAYVAEFNRQLDFAREGEKGSFRIIDLGSDERDHYFVYFGDSSVRRVSELFSPSTEFPLLKPLKHGFCVCSVTGDRAVCNACSDLEYPLQKKGFLGIGEEDGIILDHTNRVRISWANEFYLLEDWPYVS